MAKSDMSVHDDGGVFRVDGEHVRAHVDGMTSRSILQLAPNGRVLVSRATNALPPQIRVVLGWDKELARKQDTSK